MARATPLTVMVVDDQALFRRSLQDRLRSDGYDVEAASNPCVVLLDLMMPVMNGVDFLHALDKRPGTSNVRVMLVSGHGVLDRIALDSKRIVARLQKPLEMTELRSALEAQVGPGGAGPGSARPVH